MAKMIAVQECFLYNKRFRKGSEFPQEWLRAGYQPNEYFKEEGEAREILTQKEPDTRPILCAGDDPRSTDELVVALKRYRGGEIHSSWNRKQIWMALKEYENAEAKTAKAPEAKKK